MINEQDTVQYKAHQKHHKVAMSVVPNATSQPHAMVVKSQAATIAQLAVLGKARKHNLRERECTHIQRSNDTLLPYSGKFSWGFIFVTEAPKTEINPQKYGIVLADSRLL